MPIEIPVSTRRISQDDFGNLAFEVMSHVFSIHNEFGRFFNEKIYKRELVGRMDGIDLEVPITVTHDTFEKIYYVDVLVNGTGLFEFKAADAFHPKHQGQVINYLLLSDLAHAKIINSRPEKVEHRFVNCAHRLNDLRNAEIRFIDWDDGVPGARNFKEILVSLAADWGVGLELALYEQALAHFLFGEAEIMVTGTSGNLGFQRFRLAAHEVAFRLTSLNKKQESFAIHLQRMLLHTNLKAILWANITHHEIDFSVFRGPGR